MNNNPHTKPPLANVEVWVHGSDAFGEWKIIAMRKDYKQRPNVACYKDRNTFWRFVDAENGERISPREIEYWTP